jgi:hypothetical protein
LAIKYLAGERLIGTAAERAAMSAGVPDLTSEFTCTATNAVSSPLQTCGGWKYERNNSNYTASGKMHVTWKRASALYMSSYDLVGNGILSAAMTDQDFVLRFDITPLAASWATGSNRFLWAGISSNALNGSQTSQDFHGVMLRGDGATAKYCGNEGTSSTLDVNWCASNDDVNIGSEWDYSTPTTYYFEIIRDDGDIKINRYTNSTYGSVADTTGVVDDVDGATGLRYIKFCSWESGSTSGEMESAVDNVKFYKEIATVPTLVLPNLPNGTIFEESDTGKIYMFDGTDTWNETT